MPRVVLLGASALNLGLMAPAFVQRGYSVVVANRVTGSPNAARLEAVTRNGQVRALRSGHPEPFPLELVDSASPAGVARLTEFLVDEDTALVVVATRGGMPHFAALLEAAHERRREQLPVVSADNDTDPWFRERRKRNDLSGYDWRESIGDRLCMRFPPDDVTIDVVHETYGLWVVEAAGNEILQQLAGTVDVAGSVEIVSVESAELVGYTRRKLWGANGLHLAVAIMAYAKRRLLIDMFLAEPHAIQPAEKVAQALALAVNLAEPAFDLEGLFAFETAVLDRFASEQDYTMRVLGGDATVLPDDALLQRKVRDRLREPARLLQERGYTSEAALLDAVASRCPRFGSGGR